MMAAVIAVVVAFVADNGHAGAGGVRGGGRHCWWIKENVCLLL